MSAGPRVRTLGSCVAIGLALGALVTALCCAAFASQGLHMGWRPVDWLIGIILATLPMLVVFIALRVLSVVSIGLLHFLGRHAPARLSPLICAPVPVLRIVGHPLFATTITITWLVWGSPDNGPLAMYHSMFFFEIPVAAGALVGSLLGIVWGIQRVDLAPRPRSVASWVSALLALTLALGSGGWVVLPGFGDPIVRESPEALASIAQLGLADPSQPGPYAVEFASYGSGTDSRRPEYGSAVGWRTSTVDASKALPSREFPDDLYASWFWGFDDTQLPINALVWYPTDAPGRLPVALIVHGNHDAGDYSDPGYAYLSANLASHGIIAASVDENFLNGDSFFDYGGSEMGVRAWLLLRHLDQFRAWDATVGNPLYGRVDLDRVALMGHSRGGEAATLAAAIEGNQAARVPGMPEPPRGFGIRAVVAIAPSDGMDHSGSGPATPRNVDYLLLEGARDADLPAFTGLQAYHRIAVTGTTGQLKAAVYVGRANHGRFNAVWDFGDAGPLDSWLLDRGSLLSPDEQQRAAKTIIGAFLARSLQGQTGYDEFFREPRSGRDWLPADVVQSHWESSARTTLYDFNRIDPEQLNAEGFDRPRSADVPLRDGTTQRDRAALLTWPSAATLTVPIDASAVTVDPAGALVFSMVPTVDSATLADPVITLAEANGTRASLRLSQVTPPRPLLPVRLWKLAGLGARYAPTEQINYPAERFMQTYAVPLEAFLAAAPELDVAHLSSISFSFDEAGSTYLDDVALEPAVAVSS